MNFTSDKIKLKAFAKINLSLYITGTRDDGYHLLDSVFAPIDIYDEITIQKAESGIILHCNNGIPEDFRNTAYKAAEALIKKYSIYGVEISIKKNIPSMAGLGGGSSDAAAVLLGMNKLFGLGISKDELSEIGLSIGADVPFFLGEGPARVRGIGETIEPIEINLNPYIVVIKPEGALSTAQVYRHYDLYAEKKGGCCDELVEKLKEGILEEVPVLLHNDLQNPASALCGDVSDAVDFLNKNGADVSLMTGSGSCCFGIFSDFDKAEKAAATAQDNGFNAFLTRFKAIPIKIL